MPETKRILVAVGTRPEAVKMAPVITALRTHPWADVRVLATAQHRQMLDQIHEFFGIVPELDLDMMRRNQTLSDLTARMIAAMAPVLEQQAPDLVLAQGDTTTVMVTALAQHARSAPGLLALAPLGQRTLTLYIGHGVLCVLLFSGVGMGWRPGLGGMLVFSLLLWTTAWVLAKASGHHRWPLEAWLAKMAGR